MKDRRTTRNHKILGGGSEQHKILCAIDRNTAAVEKLCRLLGRYFESEAMVTKKPRRSTAQTRQLAMAFEVLKKDDLHNVRSTAVYAWQKSKGYQNFDSLYNALLKKWNCRAV